MTCQNCNTKAAALCLCCLQYYCDDCLPSHKLHARAFFNFVESLPPRLYVVMAPPDKVGKRHAMTAAATKQGAIDAYLDSLNEQRVERGQTDRIDWPACAKLGYVVVGYSPATISMPDNAAVEQLLQD